MATYTPIELPMTVASDTPTLSMSVAGNLVIGGHVPVLQTKTVYPSSTDQTIEPDTGYDALDEVDVMAVVVTNLSAANIVDGVTVKVGDANDDDSIASVTGTAQTGITPTGTKEITSNGTVNVTAYEYADVDVANSYSAGDEGKVVRSGELVAQTSATYTTNNTYDTTTINSVTVSVSGGGGATLGTKTITANDTYDASDDDLDGYSQVTVAVPASAVDTGTKSITANGNNQDVVGYAAVNVAVPNTYSAGDEGKVVSSGALVSQTAHADVTPTTSDQTIDTTTNNSIKVKGDADLVAGNIKKDVEIFGVTGSYEGGGGGGGTTLDTPGEYTVGAQDTVTVDTGLNGLINVLKKKTLKHSWDFTVNLTDSVGGLSATLGNGAAQSSSGVAITGATQHIQIPFNFQVGYTYELDISTFSKAFSSGHGRVIMINGAEGYVMQNGSSWKAYLDSSWSTVNGGNSGTAYANKTLRFTFGRVYNTYGNGTTTPKSPMTVYSDNDLVLCTNNTAANQTGNNKITIGSSSTSFYNMTITGFRIYEGVDF